jgi:hypothetical protein
MRKLIIDLIGLAVLVCIAWPVLYLTLVAMASQ